MKFKYLLTIAMVALLGACDKAKDEADDAASSMNAIDDVADMSADEARAKKELQNAIGDRIYFAYDSSTLSPEARTILEQQAAWMKKYPNIKVMIGGHCDERGTREYNIALGERRASAAHKFLVAQGACADNMTVASFGKDRPLEGGETKNRVAVTCVGSCHY